MCGICGIVRPKTEKAISDMLTSMKHRGPDDFGTYLDNFIHLGMTRLSIQDLSMAGHQPMSNLSENIFIVYNGEVYNFQNERQILLSKGHLFRSHSDTEVILKMYEEYGDEMVKRLRGMFAFAIYDKRDPEHPRLFLARDPLGIKPLVYCVYDDMFMFSSEIKALLCSKQVLPIINPEAIRMLLTYGSVVQPQTVISGVYSLMPGHQIILCDKEITVSQYWDFSIKTEKETNNKKYLDMVSEYRRNLEESIRLQLISDVPVGAFLSGGTDSSIVVSIMQKLSGQPIHTFSVGFCGEKCTHDETEDAKKIAEFLGTRHHEVIIDGSEVKNHLSRFVVALDQPSVDGLNTYFVSYAASKTVKVAISGTGGDEFLAGYPWFMKIQKYSLEIKHSPLKKTWNLVLGTILKSSLFDRFIGGCFGEFIERRRGMTDIYAFFFRQYDLCGSSLASRLLSSKMKKKTRMGVEPSKEIFFNKSSIAGRTPVQITSLLTARSYLQNQLLRDIDAVSMYHSLEVRVPFLDHKLCEYTLNLDDKTKLNSDAYKFMNSDYQVTGAKKILLDVGKDILPDWIMNRPKRGFSLPFDSWMKGPLRETLDEMLSLESTKRRGIFNPEEVWTVLQDFYAGKCQWSIPWVILVTELWFRTIIDPLVENNNKQI